MMKEDIKDQSWSTCLDRARHRVWDQTWDDVFQSNEEEGWWLVCKNINDLNFRQVRLECAGSIRGDV